MSDQDKYTVVPSRNTEVIRKNYNDDALKMRAKAAKARIKAKQKAEKMPGKGLPLKKFLQNIAFWKIPFN